MARRLSWTESAWTDLDEIADHIARDSHHYAGAFVAALRASARVTAHTVEARSGRARVEDSSVREVFVHRYRLIYKVLPQSVIVLGVIHGARDLEALWKREERDV